MECNISIYTNDAIENVAEALLNEAQAFEGSFTQLVKLANYLSLNVIKTTFTDCTIDGMLKYEGEQKNIYVNKTQPENRQRFTVAHEIGHYILHRDMVNLQGGNILYRKSNQNDPIEIQANIFAGAILMPKKEIIAAYKALKDIYLVAKMFKTSPEATYIRLKKLGVISA